MVQNIASTDTDCTLEVGACRHGLHIVDTDCTDCWGRVSGSSAGRCLGSKAFTWKFLQRLVATDITKAAARSSKISSLLHPTVSTVHPPKHFLQHLFLSPCPMYGSALLVIHCMVSSRLASLKRGETSWKLLKMRHQCLIETREGKEWRC